MDKKKINTIEMTREIRDEHARRLAGKSHAERIARPWRVDGFHGLASFRQL